MLHVIVESDQQNMTDWIKNNRRMTSKLGGDFKIPNAWKNLNAWSMCKLEENEMELSVDQPTKVPKQNMNIVDEYTFGFLK